MQLLAGFSFLVLMLVADSAGLAAPRRQPGPRRRSAPTPTAYPAVGDRVSVVQKVDYASGLLTNGTVARVLTRSRRHSRGFKVMLQGGVVGRVQHIVAPADGRVESGTEDGGVSSAQLLEADIREVAAGGRPAAAASSTPSLREQLLAENAALRAALRERRPPSAPPRPPPRAPPPAMCEGGGGGRPLAEAALGGAALLLPPLLAAGVAVALGMGPGDAGNGGIGAPLTTQEVRAMQGRSASPSDDAAADSPLSFEAAAEEQALVDVLRGGVIRAR